MLVCIVGDGVMIVKSLEMLPRVSLICGKYILYRNRLLVVWLASQAGTGPEFLQTFLMHAGSRRQHVSVFQTGV